MKSFVKKSVVALPLLICSLAGLSSCTKERRAFSFVAVSDTEWNTSVTIGEWQYKFKGNLLDDHSVVFKATTVDKKASQGQGGGPGGFPFGQVNPLAEGGPQGGNQEQEEDKPTEEELRAQDFEFKGEWVEEKGFGYILTLADEENTVIHADYNKTEGRHQFYYNVTNKEGVSSTVFFQAKDPTYRDRLSKEYQTWDNRDSDYIYKAKSSGNNGSLAYAYLYLHKDKSVVINAPKSGSAGREVTIGMTWSEEADGTIKVVDGETTYTSAESKVSEHPGKKIDIGSLTYLLSESETFKWTKFTAEDFEGKAKMKFEGEKSQMMSGTIKVYLYLNSDGTAKYYEGYSFKPVKSGTYTESNGSITITFGEKTLVSKTDDEGNRTFEMVSQSSGPFGGSSTIVLTEIVE